MHGRYDLAMRSLLSLACLGIAIAAQAVERPNIVLIITDDQGYGDLSIHGNPVLKTPNLDRLAKGSVRFTDFLVSPTCAPTRSALLTGRHEFKNGITHTILERERLTLDAVTLPERLKSVGYTTGIFGKWHLGDEDAYQPGKRGYDETYIHGAGGIGQTYAGSCGDAPKNSYFGPYVLHNGTFEKTTAYCTDVFFDGAIRWMEKTKGPKPFFCHIATNAPHAPLNARPEDQARYAGKGLTADQEKFFGMIANIDDNVGKLLDKLDEWKITNDTLVIFLNDNGGTVGAKVFNAGMRGQKGTPWRGGTRAACFWRWPGHFTPNDVSSLSAHIDILPTLAQLTGFTMPEKAARQVEGLSRLAHLEGTKIKDAERALFTHVGRWPKGTNPDLWKYANASVRTPRWQMVTVDKDRKKAWQLFDVIADPGETKDVAAANPATVADLDKQYDAWWAACRPLLVNEEALPAARNSFHERFERQYGKK
jgi:arylsulfatase A-like enzyme